MLGTRSHKFDGLCHDDTMYKCLSRHKLALVLVWKKDWSCVNSTSQTCLIYLLLHAHLSLVLLFTSLQNDLLNSFKVWFIFILRSIICFPLIGIYHHFNLLFLILYSAHFVLHLLVVHHYKNSDELRIATMLN